MSDKISPIAVVKESLAIGWARKWTLFGITFLLLISVPFIALMSLLEEQDSFVVLCSFGLVAVCGLLAMVFMVTTVSHFSVTSQRGEGVVIPSNLLGRMGNVTVRGILLWLAAMLMIMGLMIPAVGTLALLAPQDGSISGMVAMVLIPLMLCGTLLIHLVIMRLSIVIPGASVGEITTFSQAWSMTKGHTWRIFLSYSIIMVASMVISLLPHLLINDFDPGGAPGIDIGFIALSLLSFVVSLVSYCVGLISCGVWYEKLRFRHEVIPATPPNPEME